MRGDVRKFKFCTFTQNHSGLIVKSLEIPHYAYSSRHKQKENKNHEFLTYDILIVIGINII